MKTMIVGLFGIAALMLLQPALAAGDAQAGKGKVAACVACHGSDGNSAAPSFPRLAGLGEKYLSKQLLDIQSGARPVAEMTGMLTNLSQQDLDDIAAFYDAQTPQLAGATDNAKSLALGERVYRAGNLKTGVPACTGCHSPSGNGNAPAGYPVLGGQHAAYLAKQLHAFRTGAHDEDDPAGRRNDEVKVMRGVAAQMTDQEIKAVANYMSGLH
jgi:cytochrome c553